jgi:hypothetical protein
MSSWRRDMETGNGTRILSDCRVKGVVETGLESPLFNNR